ncbi:T9SS type A sorting domain-containing protein [bacterium]|nr:T9SS type A sorting domain-containing protein [bacterium]
MKRVTQILMILSLFCSVFGSILADEETPDWSEIIETNRSIINNLLNELGPGTETVFIGDMAFRSQDLYQFWCPEEPGKSAFTGTSWTDGKVYYTFVTTGDGAVDAQDQSAFREATTWWECTAQLEFIEVSPGDQSNYIEVHSGDGNWSYVGMIGGLQELEIFNWNRVGIIAHEIGHALGLSHEHQRSDRDNYITILFDNIDDSDCDESCQNTNFGLISATVNLSGYDFQSLMHYGRSAFGSGDLNTIEPLAPYSDYLTVIGQRSYISYRDTEGMAERYGRRVEILIPATGEPVITRMTPRWYWWDDVENIDIQVSVFDEDGDAVTGLSSTDFAVLVNDEDVDEINSVSGSAGHYTLNITPRVLEEGLYDLKVIYVGLADEPIGVGVKEGSVLYTNQPLVERGLRWLRERQTASGYWNGPSGYSDRCGVTGLALQAFLAAGCSPDDDEDVRRGIQYLLDHQQGNGGIYYNGFRSGYKTAMALTALKSAAKYNPSNLAQIESAITAAENFYVNRQHPTYGGWRYEPQNGYDYDLSVSQWPILALKGVDNATLWDRVRRLLHTYCRHSSGGYKYQYYSGVSATMTCAGIWGEVIAGGPQSNIDAAFQWLENQYGSATGIVNAYDRAQRYYYLYSLAKACALAGKTRLAGENWFEILTDRLDDTQQLDFWHTQGYWHNSYVAWENDEMSTALALLSLQVGTVPPDSRMRVYFVNNGPPKDNSASRYSQASASTMPSEIQGLYISIFDMDGNYAGPDENGNWITTIPGSQWISTGEIMEFDVPLERASTFSGEIHNNQNESALYTLRFEVYQGDNPDPVDEEEFEGQILPYQVLGTNASVNAIGGLSVYVSPLEIFPQMWLLPDLVEFTPLVNDTVYEFSFFVKETGGAANLNNIDVFVSSDLQDEEGNILSRHWFAFSPSHVDAVQAGDSVLITGTLSIPGADEFDAESVGTFEGLITVESTRQSRAIQVRASAGKGVLEGSILANNGQGVNGVRIDLYDTLGRLRVSGTTEREGLYYVSGIPFGTYSVVMTTPLGYRTDEESMVRTIGREPTTANFTVTALNNVPSQRTLGYWAGQVNAAVLGAPRDYTPDQLSDLAGLISNHFNNHLMNPVKAYMVEGPADAEDSLNTLGLVLATGAVTVNEPILQRTARKQLVALLLNVVSGKLDQNTVCTEDGHPVSDVITYANMLISQPDSMLPPVPEWYTHSQLPWGQYEIAAHLAECVNSGLMLASHTIPMDILEVAYRLNEETVLPEHFFLSQNYPNPFNPTTDIDFYLPDATHVTLTVYNTLGQEVCVLLDRFMPAGLHTVTWRGIDHQGSKVATGIYLYRIVAGENESNRKMILVK